MNFYILIFKEHTINISSKKWLVTSISLLFIILALSTLFLFLTDTYSIVNAKSKVYYSIPNQRYLIAEHLLDTHPDYDTLIFGSSRVGFINPFKLKHKKAYNMTYAEGIPHEHLLMLRLLLKNGMKIKNILLGLDDFSYQVSFASHQQQLGSRLHYKATNTSKFEFYKFYFFRKPTANDLNHFKRKFLTVENSGNLEKNHIYNTIFNQPFEYSNISYPDNNNDKYKNQPCFLQPSHYSGNYLEETLQDIQEIVTLAKQKDINLKIFINPLHHATHADTNKKLLQKFRKRLSNITSYYDFSLPNKVNDNNAYWNETSHYGYYVGNLIITKIYEHNCSIEDFGLFIKQEK